MVKERVKMRSFMNVSFWTRREEGTERREEGGYLGFMISFLRGRLVVNRWIL